MKKTVTRGIDGICNPPPGRHFRNIHVCFAQNVIYRGVFSCFRVLQKKYIEKKSITLHSALKKYIEKENITLHQIRSI